MSYSNELNELLHIVKAMNVMKNEMLMLIESMPNGRRSYDGYLEAKKEEWRKKSDSIDRIFLTIAKGE